MPFYMKRSLLIGVFLFLTLAIISGCRESYNSDLKTPDIDDAGMVHGYNLTPLGCLVYSPWAIESEANSDSNILNDLVFECQENGKLYYWFKKDYLKSPDDTITLADGNKSYGHTTWKSDYLIKKKLLKNIYKQGHWKANFKDSSILIDFGNNTFHLSKIDGKYISLDNEQMTIKQKESKENTFKIILSFEHY